MISLGNYWGKKYNDLYLFFKKYVPLKIKENISLKNWSECGEFLNDPEMYLQPGFIPSKNDVIYDIGSQFADYAIYWAIKYHARVYAFEGLSDNYIKAVKNIESNFSNMNNRPIFNDIKMFNLFVGNDSRISYEVKGNMAAVGLRTMGQSQSVALDSFVIDSGILLPDIIKIDVEGYEYQVLQGAMNLINTHRPKIILEVHSKDLLFECHKFLTGLGYKIAAQGRVIYNNRIPGRVNCWMDRVQNLFYLPKD